jgi:hypothetical protein
MGHGGAARDFMKSSQLGKAFPSHAHDGEVYDLLKSIDLVVFDQFQRRCPMPKLSQYASYMALAAALFVGFALTVQVGMHF